MAYGFEYELQVCAEDVRKSMVLAQKVEYSVYAQSLKQQQKKPTNKLKVALTEILLFT